jgi:transcriptional regulator with XRE-family HTH domain
MTQSRFGRVLKNLRISSGYTSGREFSRDCGLSRETIRNYESGQTMPSNQALLQMLKVLDLNLDSEGSKEVVAALHEGRRNRKEGEKRSYGVAANAELSRYLDDSAVSDDKVEQLLALFSEYISPDRQSPSFLHFLRTRIIKILE